MDATVTTQVITATVVNNQVVATVTPQTVTATVGLGNMPGATGEDGPAIELQVGGGYIQYRTIGATTWTNLIATATLVGATGTPGTPGTPGAPGTDGTDGTNGSDGATGPAIELQVAGGYIQWRVVGAVTWINLVATATLKGNTGDTGAAGTTTVGNTLFVDAVNGSDSTGTRGRADLPYLTPGAAIAAASSGDVIRMGPGVFAITTGLVLPAGVHLRGAGMGVTIIQVGSAAGDFAAVTPGSGSVLADFAVRCLGDSNTLQVPIGNYGSAVTGVLGINLELISFADGIRPNYLSGAFWNCRISTQYDCVTGTYNTIDLHGCTLVSWADDADAALTNRCLVAPYSSTIRMFGGTLSATGATTGQHVTCCANVADATGSIELHDVKCTVAGGAGATAKADLYREAGALTVIGGSGSGANGAYTTSGAITVAGDDYARDVVHAAATTGVHGVGAGTVAKTSDIPSIAGLIPATLADANSILYAVTDDTPAALALAANTFPVRASTGDIVAKPLTDAALSILDDTTVAAMRATLAAYRYAVTNAVGNVSGSVTPDFGTSLTNSYTLTGNCTALPAPSNMADAETAVGLFTLATYAMPAGPASGVFKGNWTVTGPIVRVIWLRVGSNYFASADSLTVVP